MFFVTFFEKKVTPKNFTVGKVLAYIVRSTVVRTLFAQTKVEKFSSTFFKRWRGVKGRVAPYIVRQTQERVNFFALQRKRENPRRGFSFFS